MTDLCLYSDWVEAEGRREETTPGRRLNVAGQDDRGGRAGRLAGQDGPADEEGWCEQILRRDADGASRYFGGTLTNSARGALIKWAKVREEEGGTEGHFKRKKGGGTKPRYTDYEGPHNHATLCEKRIGFAATH